MIRALDSGVRYRQGSLPSNVAPDGHYVPGRIEGPRALMEHETRPQAHTLPRFGCVACFERCSRVLRWHEDRREVLRVRRWLQGAGRTSVFGSSRAPGEGAERRRLHAPMGHALAQGEPRASRGYCCSGLSAGSNGRAVAGSWNQTQASARPLDRSSGARQQGGQSHDMTHWAGTSGRRPQSQSREPWAALASRACLFSCVLCASDPSLSLLRLPDLPVGRCAAAPYALLTILRRSLCARSRQPSTTLRLASVGCKSRDSDALLLWQPPINADT